MENSAVTHGEAQFWITYGPQSTVGMELPAGFDSPTGEAPTSIGSQEPPSCPVFLAAVLYTQDRNGSRVG